MATKREALILEALFGGASVPFEFIDTLPEIQMHIAALLALRDRKVMPLKSGQRLNADPLKSQALNLRIAQLWENPAPDGHKRSWPEVASEVGAGLTASSARNRYLRYQAQQQEHLRGEAYRALSGRAEPLDDEPEGRSILSHIKDARDPLPTIRNSLIVEPESSDEGAMSGDTPPPSMTEPEILKEIIKTESASQEFISHDHSGGQAIDKQDHIPEVTKMDPLPDCQRDGAARQEAATIRNSRIVGQDDNSAEPVQNIPPSAPAPEKSTPTLTDEEVDQVISKLQGNTARAIAAELRKAGKEISSDGVRERQAAMWAKKKGPAQAPPEKPAAPKTDLPPIGPKSNRREIDEFMWSLWNHGKGKTPDKISDILCEKGFSYGTKSVERRLRQQGGDL